MEVRKRKRGRWSTRKKKVQQGRRRKNQKKEGGRRKEKYQGEGSEVKTKRSSLMAG